MILFNQNTRNNVVLSRLFHVKNVYVNLALIYRAIGQNICLFSNSTVLIWQGDHSIYVIVDKHSSYFYWQKSLAALRAT